MQMIVGYLVLYLSIICGSICISKIFKKKIESCIVIDIFIKMILLYIFGLTNILYVGTILINIIPIILGIITIIKNRKTEEFKESILTNGLMFFTVIYFLFIIFTFYKVTNDWDEYSYWSIVTKKMYYSDKMVNTGILVLYPPFPTILQYYFAKTVNMYSQGIEIFANYILGFSLLLPLYERVKSKDKVANICLGIVIMCIPAVFTYILFYQSIYADSILGLLIGYIFYQLYNENNNKFLFFSLSLGFTVLTLTKATGVYIALIILLAMFILYLTKCIKNRKKIKILENLKENKNNIIAFISILSIVLITSISWSVCIKNYPIDKDEIERKDQQDNEQYLSISDALKTAITTVFGGRDETNIDRDVSNMKLFYAIYEKNAINQPVRISLITFLLLYIIGIIILYKYIIKDENKEKFKKLQIIILISFILYVGFLQLAYLTKFSVEESLKHASFERYVNTFFLASTVVLFSIILDKIDESNRNLRFKYLILTLSVLMITPINVITDATITSGVVNTIKKDELSDVSEQAKNIKEKLNKEDRIYIINQESDVRASTWQLKYFLIPEIDIKTTRKFNERLEKTFLTEGGLLKKWEDVLYNDYDYVYIYKTDEYFNNLAKEIFESEEIKEKTIYKIQRENERVKLIEY